MALSKSEPSDTSESSKPLIVMNIEDHQLTAEMSPLQPLFVIMKRNGYSEMITLLKDKIEHIAVSICICIFNLDNKQWLDGVIQLVMFHKQHHGLDDKLQKAVGIMLLLFNDIKIKDLPAQLQLLTCLTVTNLLNKKNCDDLRQNLQQIHANRMFSAKLMSKSGRLCYWPENGIEYRSTDPIVLKKVKEQNYLKQLISDHWQRLVYVFRVCVSVLSNCFGQRFKPKV